MNQKKGPVKTEPWGIPIFNSSLLIFLLANLPTVTTQQWRGQDYLLLGGGGGALHDYKGRTTVGVFRATECLPGGKGVRGPPPEIF